MSKAITVFQGLEFSRCLSPEEDCYGNCMEGYKQCNLNTASNICRPLEECKNLEDEEKTNVFSTTTTTTSITTASVATKHGMTTRQVSQFVVHWKSSTNPHYFYSSK